MSDSQCVFEEDMLLKDFSGNFCCSFQFVDSVGVTRCHVLTDPQILVVALHDIWL